MKKRKIVNGNHGFDSFASVKRILLSTIFSGIACGAAIGQGTSVFSLITVGESLSTSFLHPARHAFDGKQETFWELESGSTDGWAVNTLGRSIRLGSISADLSLPEGVSFEILIAAGDHWENLPGGVLRGPFTGEMRFEARIDAAPIGKIMARLNGEAASQAKVYGLSMNELENPETYGKIKPRDYSFNQQRYINIDPERLWDDRIWNSWYEPFYGLPQNVMDGNVGGVHGVFPSYNGHPEQDGEIIWELGQERDVEVMKAFFILPWRSVTVQFWNGSDWGSQVTISGPAGWNRVALSGAARTSRIRMSFPGSWENARFISEVEFWGKGLNDVETLALPIPGAGADGRSWFTLDEFIDEKIDIVVSLDGLLTSSLEMSWNGIQKYATPETWAGDATIYRLFLDEADFREGTQFLSIKTTREIESVIVRKERDHGRIGLGWPWDDGFLKQAVFEGMQNLPVGHKTWNLGGAYQLEMLRVYGPNASFLEFFTGSGDTRQSIVWTASGDGWKEASLDGVQASSISCENVSPAVITEIELYGTRTGPFAPQAELWRPHGLSYDAASSTEEYLIGWMNEDSGEIEVADKKPLQDGNIFWIKEGDAGADGRRWFDVRYWNENGEGKRHCHRKNAKGAGAIDQGEDFLATDSATIALSGTVEHKDTRVFIQGAEVVVELKAFTSVIELTSGYQTLNVVFMDKQGETVLDTIIKPIWRSPGDPTLVFDNPPGDSLIQESSMLIKGRVGNGIGLNLTRGNAVITLDGQKFVDEVPLAEGTNDFAYTLTDETGRSVVFTLRLVRDGNGPSISIVSPLDGETVSNTTVHFIVESQTDAALWWKVNDGEWMADLDGEFRFTETVSDGWRFYEFRAMDRAGNVSAAERVDFCVDSSPPLAFAIGTDAIGWTNDVTPTLSFSTTDALSGIDHYEYSGGGSGWVSVESPFEVPALTDGVHVLSIAAVDKAGNRRTETIPVQIDTSAPAAPVGFKLVPGMASIRAEWLGVDDGEGFQDYRIERMPVWAGATRDVPGNSYGISSLKDEGLGFGDEYSYRAWAVDRAGNEGPKTDWLSSTAGIAEADKIGQGPTVVEFDGVRLTIPESAVADDIVRFKIMEIPADGLSDLTEHSIIGGVYSFSVVREMNGVETESEHADFSQDVEIVMSYDPAEIPTGRKAIDLRPHYLDTIWGRWMPLDRYFVNPKAKTITCTVKHFSILTNLDSGGGVSVQEMRGIASGSMSSSIRHDGLSVNPEVGSVNTGFSELSLPGKNGLGLGLRRYYDTTKAQQDCEEKGTANADPNAIDGDAPWKIGKGWRMQFPSMNWSGSGLWITGLDGVSFSFGQAQLPVSWGNWAENDVTVVMESHESVDVQVELKYRLKFEFHFPLLPGRVFKIHEPASAMLRMKDGRVVNYDGKGRVTSISDYVGLNSINFTYDGNAATITDSMGRVIKTTYGLHGITNVSVAESAATGARSYRDITYDIDATEGTLKTAIDVQGRAWNYTYEKIGLATRYELLYDPIFSSSDTKTRTVSVIKTIAGLGIGKQKVEYQPVSTYYEDTQQYTWGITQPRLQGRWIRVYGDVDAVTDSGPGIYPASPMRSYGTEITLVHAGDGQFTAIQSKVSDGRYIATTDYRGVYKDRLALSEAPEAFRIANPWGDGMRADAKEWLQYPQTITRRMTTGKAIELETQAWDDATLKIKEMTLTKYDNAGNLVVNNRFSSLYGYDAWGNMTSATRTDTIGARVTRVVTTNTYYLDYEPESTPNYNQEKSLPGGLKLSHPSSTSRFNRSLIASSKTTSYGKRAEGADAPESAIESFTAFTYTALGQLNRKYVQGADGAWAVSEYAFRNGSDGQIGRYTAPGKTSGQAGQIVDYDYDYAEPYEYRITTTLRSVDLDAADSNVSVDLVTRVAYDRLSGLPFMGVNAKGQAWRREYDNLGRITYAWGAGKDDAALNDYPAPDYFPGGGTILTECVYDDALTGPSVTITEPSGLESEYEFDARGRMTEVRRINQKFSSLKPENVEEETIVSRVSYDDYDQVLTSSGPYSTIEAHYYDQTRSLAALTTAFDYDDRGRIIEILAPGETEPVRFQYDDASNTVEITNEEGVRVRKTTDWNGRAISVGAFFEERWISSSRFYDGSGRTLAVADPLGRMTTIDYNGWSLPETMTAPPRSVAMRSADGSVNQGLESASPSIHREYYDDGSLKAVIRDTGIAGTESRAEIVYNGIGMVLSSSAAANPTQTIQAELAYDAAGNVISTTLRETGSGNTAWKNHSVMGYDGRNRLVSKDTYFSEAEFGRTTFQYDAADNLTQVTDPRGNAKIGIDPKYTGNFTVTMEYDELGRVINASLPALEGNGTGGTAQYVYDGSGNAIEARKPDGSLEKLRFTIRNLLKTVSIEGEGNAATEEDDVAALLTSFDYDKAGRLETIAYPSGITVARTYDDLGRVTSEGDAAIGITEYNYDDMGNVTWIQDGNHKSTEFQYNPEGLVTKTIDALDKEWITDYDIMNLPARLTDPNGNREEYAYDRLGRLTTEKTARGAVLSYGYDAAGNPVSFTDGRATAFIRAFDWANSLTGETATNATIDPERTIVEELSLAYDEGGQLKTAFNGSVLTAYNLQNGTYRPNPYGLVRSVDQNVGGRNLRAAFDYDDSLRLTSVATPDGLSVGYGYDAIGRLKNYERTTQQAAGDTPAKGIFGSLAYNPQTGLLETVSLGNTVTQSFDYEHGRLKELAYEKFGESEALKRYEYEYDMAGNIVSKTVDGQANANTYEYDDRYMLVRAREFGFFQKTSDELENVAYGKATRDREGLKPLSFTVDATETLRLDMENQSLGIDLGAPYLVSKIDLMPNSSTHRVAPKDITVLKANVNSGVGADWTKVNADNIVFDVDPATRAIIIRFKAPVETQYLKVNTIWDDRDAENQSVPGLNGFQNTVKQLVKVWVITTENTENYRYDDAGNRLGMNAFTYIYRQNASGKNTNLLEHDGTWNYFYDQNGNTTAKAKAKLGSGANATPDISAEYWTYAYDLHNRLIEVFHNGTAVAEYVYDATGMMVLREDAKGKNTRYLYSTSGELLYKEKADEGFARSIVYGQAGIAGWTDTKDAERTNYYALTDHLGSVVMVTDEAGTSLWESEYRPFGQVAGATGTMDMDGIFTGKEIDPDTGLYYFNARWYDPETARFMTEDPIKDGATWYAYCGNNPANFTDPSGLKKDDGTEGGYYTSGGDWVGGGNGSSTLGKPSEDEDKNPTGKDLSEAAKENPSKPKEKGNKDGGDSESRKKGKDYTAEEKVQAEYAAARAAAVKEAEAAAAQYRAAKAEADAKASAAVGNGNAAEVGVAALPNKSQKLNKAYEDPRDPVGKDDRSYLIPTPGVIEGSRYLNSRSRWTSGSLVGFIAPLTFGCAGPAGRKGAQLCDYMFFEAIGTTINLPGGEGVDEVVEYADEVVEYFDDVANAIGRQSDEILEAAANVGRYVSSVDDVLTNPSLLEGKTLAEVQKALQGATGWVDDVMRSSTRAEGWVFREMNEAGTDFTGRIIQYHPGTPRHYNGAPYWKVSTGTGGTVRFPARGKL